MLLKHLLTLGTDVSNMHTFGQTCFALINNPKKLDPRAEKCIFVGYDTGSPAYIIYFPNKETVKKVRCVNFHESKLKQDFVQTSNDNNDENDLIFVKQGMNDNSEQVYPNMMTPPCEIDVEADVTSPKSARSTDLNPTRPTPNQPAPSTSSSHVECDKRTRQRPKHLDDYFCDNEIDENINNVIHYCYNLNFDVPVSYDEAMSSPLAQEWETAMQSEMKALEESNTYDIVPLPKGRELVGVKWVYAIKSDKEGNDLYKARFVAKGYSQVKGINYHETFSPTVRMNSVRMITQIATENNLDIDLHQMDFKSAYLNAPIDCDIYVEQPKGFKVKSNNGDNLVWRLKKSLYGLKQSGRNWNNTIHAYLIESGYERSKNDPCLYFNNSTFILVWVDDLLIAAKPNVIESVKRVFTKIFEMKDLVQIALFLGIEFDVNSVNNTISMSQEKYAKKLLHKFGMQDSKPRYTPCEVKSNVINKTLLDENDANLYRQIVGCLIYLMTCMRPDLSFTVTKLSQHMSKPDVYHMTMAKHALRYVKGTVQGKLIFRKSDEPLIIEGYCDADWASSLEDRKSITGYCFQISPTGPMISWKSRKQPTVALSTCEAEYMSLVAAIQEGKYLTSFLNEIINLNQKMFTLHSDNQSAIALAKNPVQHQRTKHIDVKYHFVRDGISDGKLKLLYVPSENNLADLFTKPVAKPNNCKFKSMIMGK